MDYFDFSRTDVAGDAMLAASVFVLCIVADRAMGAAGWFPTDRNGREPISMPRPTVLPGRPCLLVAGCSLLVARCYASACALCAHVRAVPSGLWVAGVDLTILRSIDPSRSPARRVPQPPHPR